MPPWHVRVSVRLLECFLPQRDADAVIGDLAEEYTLVSGRGDAALGPRWYWGQVWRSIPYAMWLSIRRGGWVATIGVAVGGCVLQAASELAVNSVLSQVFPNARVPIVLILLTSLVLLSVVGYAAASIRAGAPVVVAALIVAITALVLLLKQEDPMPLWFRLISLVLGPFACLTGGRLSLKRRLT